MSHDYKTSFDAGELVPVMNMEILPGDTITLNNEFLVRMAPMINPIMHNVDVTVHYFYVPYRLLWSGFDDFIKSINTPSNRPAMPYFNSYEAPALPGTLLNYLGIPAAAGGEPLNALHAAAYQFIYDQYYKDQNVSSELDQFEPLPDGLVTGVPLIQLTVMRRRAWQHDLFTSALPWEQFGAAVKIPVDFAGGGDVLLKQNAPFGIVRSQAGDNFPPGNQALNTDGGSSAGILKAGGVNSVYDPNGSLTVTPFSGNSGTINDLRRAFSLQRISEKLARFGRRVNEFYQGIWGVNPGDARIDRPEYLGGIRNPMVISEVLQTSESVETPQGNMAGHGISVGGKQAFRYHAKEFGVVMAIASVMPKTAYQQGIPKKFSRFSPFDYAFPDFANIGEEPVYNREIYAGSIDGQNGAVFGYTPRYAHYKFEESRVTGEFQTSLNSWHWSRIFNNRPNLNTEFIQCKPDKRIFAVQTEEFDSFYAHIFHNVYVRRNLPMYADPI